MVRCSSVNFDNTILNNLRNVLDSSPNKELSGALKLSFNKKQNCFSVGVGKIQKGTAEEATLVETMHNFHTHPRDAYIAHNTNIGWPSESDFKTFMYCFFRYKNIMHCVCGLEGIYVITIHPDSFDYLMNKPSLQETKQRRIDTLIEKIYIDKDIPLYKRPSFDGVPITTPEQYVDFVNKTEMLKNKPLFKLTFIQWDNPDKIVVCNPWIESDKPKERKKSGKKKSGKKKSGKKKSKKNIRTGERTVFFIN